MQPISTPVSTAFRGFVQQHGPVYEWSERHVGDFLRRVSFPSRSISAFETHGVDGGIFLELDNATLQAIGLSPVDQLRFRKIVQALEDEHDDVALIRRDLKEIRAFSRSQFYTLFLVGALHPFSALLLIHSNQSGFDALVYREHAAARSPFSLPAAALAPSWVLWQYLAEFKDTNANWVAFIAVALAAHQVAHWLRLGIGIARCLRSPRTGHAELAREAGYFYCMDVAGSCCFAAAFRYLLFPLTPRLLLDASFHLLVLAGPLVPLYYCYAVYVSAVGEGAPKWCPRLSWARGSRSGGAHEKHHRRRRRGGSEASGASSEPAPSPESAPSPPPQLDSSPLRQQNAKTGTTAHGRCSNAVDEVTGLKDE